MQIEVCLYPRAKFSLCGFLKLEVSKEDRSLSGLNLVTIHEKRHLRPFENADLVLFVFFYKFDLRISNRPKAPISRRLLLVHTEKDDRVEGGIEDTLGRIKP